MKTISKNYKIAIAVSLMLAMLAVPEGAYAFEDAAKTITNATCQAVRVGKKILVTAASLAFMVGLAPMLWGEVKTKWLISCLIFVTFLGVVNSIVGAFGSGSAC